jgi:integrase
MACKVKVNRHGFLAFRLYWDGHESWEGTGLKDTAKNRQRMDARAVLISEEMERRTFDYLAWFPAGNKANLFNAAIGKAEDEKTEPKTIRQYYNDWIKDKNPPLVKKSRGRKYRSHFTVNILPLHGDKWMHLYGVTEIREMLADLTQRKHLTVKTAKNVMNATLRAFFRDAVAEKVIERNPFDDLPKKFWPKTVTSEPDPFSEEERDRIIAYFFEKYWGKWPDACVFIYMQFWTGQRPSEAIDRRHKDYDPRTGNLAITSSRTEGESGATKTTKSKRTITLLPPVREYLDQIRPLHVTPNDYILKNRHGDPIDQDGFAARHFWPALRALNIRHRDFYATRDTFVSVMLMHGEPAKRVAEYCGTSLAMIENSYGKWIGGSKGFGEAALKAAKPKPSPKPREADEIDFEQIQVVGMAERGGFEPPVPLLGVHTISSRAPSTARSPLHYVISSTYAHRPAL